MDCVNCLIGFANNKTSHRISLKAIALLRICEDRLAEVSTFLSPQVYNGFRISIYLFIPLLLNLLLFPD